MRYKVAELNGALLDEAVAKADGIESSNFHPSRSWLFGGPIIERERIELIPQRMVLTGREDAAWNAVISDHPGGWATTFDAFGQTPLIAAMRAYVESKFGDEVELPAGQRD